MLAALDALPGSVDAETQRNGVVFRLSTAPESLVQAVCDALEPDEVKHLGLASEDIEFTLPVEMRDAVPPRQSSSWATSSEQDE